MSQGNKSAVKKILFAVVGLVVIGTTIQMVTDLNRKSDDMEDMADYRRPRSSLQAASGTGIKSQAEPQAQTASPTINTTSAYTGYMQEISAISNFAVTRQTIGKFEVAKSNFVGFVDVRNNLQARINADASLDANQKQTLSNSLQTEFGKVNCDTIANQTNSKLNDYYTTFACNAAHDNTFVQAYIAAFGVEAAASKLEAVCP